jgi:hypothetical protein
VIDGFAAYGAAMYPGYVELGASLDHYDPVGEPERGQAVRDPLERPVQGQPVSIDFIEVQGCPRTQTIPAVSRNWRAPITTLLAKCRWWTRE